MKNSIIHNEKNMMNDISDYLIHKNFLQKNGYQFLPDFSDNLQAGSLATKIFKNVSNAYRKRFCDNRARPLYDGEIHVNCANWEGPGTRIDLPEVRNYPPYNNVDACARTHDLDYEQAGKNLAQKESMIRSADIKFNNCIDKFPNEHPYYELGKLILLKTKIEDLLPIFSKTIFGKYKGK